MRIYLPTYTQKSFKKCDKSHKTPLTFVKTHNKISIDGAQQYKQNFAKLLHFFEIMIKYNMRLNKMLKINKATCTQD